MIRVYIASPYSKGDKEANVNKAIDIANKLYDMEYAPYIPVLTHFWELCHHRPYEEWLVLDREFILCCDCILRIDGDSSGADDEIKFAREANIPVFYSIKDLNIWRAMTERGER